MDVDDRAATLPLLSAAPPIGNVVLCGGASRMPCVVRLVKELTGIVPRKTVSEPARTASSLSLFLFLSPSFLFKSHVSARLVCFLSFFLLLPTTGEARRRRERRTARNKGA